MVWRPLHSGFVEAAPGMNTRACRSRRFSAAHNRGGGTGFTIPFSRFVFQVRAVRGRDRRPPSPATVHSAAARFGQTEKSSQKALCNCARRHSAAFAHRYKFLRLVRVKFITQGRRWEHLRVAFSTQETTYKAFSVDDYM